MSKTRTFIAVDAIDEVHVQALQAIDRLSSAADQVKWVTPDNLHWTLQFLGDISDQEIAEVCQRTGKVAERMKPFLLTAAGVGAFPSVDRPKTLWLGAGQGSEDMCELQQVIEESLSPMGFRGERRRFVPHLTLGRIGRGSSGASVLGERLARLEDFQGGQMSVDEVVVYASELTREGPIYTPLAHLPLLGEQ